MDQGKDGKVHAHHRSVRRAMGNKLKPELLAVTVGGKNIMEFCDMSVAEAIRVRRSDLKLSETHIAESQKRSSKEIKGRLTFLANVGLDYLTLSRAAATLSGGESQRIRLATQIGSGLVGRALYPGRAEHRTASEGQRQAAGGAEKI